MMAAASITHDRGFHINPKNFKNLLSYTHPKRINICEDDTKDIALVKVQNQNIRFDVKRTTIETNPQKHKPISHEKRMVIT